MSHNLRTIQRIVVAINKREGKIVSAPDYLELLVQLRALGAYSTQDAKLQKKNPKAPNYKPLTEIAKTLEYCVEEGILSTVIFDEESRKEILLYVSGTITPYSTKSDMHLHKHLRKGRHYVTADE